MEYKNSYSTKIKRKKINNSQIRKIKQKMKNKKFEPLTMSKSAATTKESASRGWETPVQELKMADQEQRKIDQIITGQKKKRSDQDLTDHICALP